MNCETGAEVTYYNNLELPSKIWALKLKLFKLLITNNLCCNVPLISSDCQLTMTLITGNKETKPPHMCKEYLEFTKNIYNLNSFISIQMPFHPQIQSYFSLLFSGNMFVVIFPVLIFKLLLSPSIFEFFSS